MKMSAPLSEEQQLVMLESCGPAGNLALTNHETEYRLCEIAKAAAGIKKLLAMAEESAHRAALADHVPGRENKFTNEMVVRRMRKARQGVEMVLARVDSLVTEYEMKDGIKKR
ncbi:hypothetical protein CMI37_34365 [Candidatus Pacearchaeota archaeon]|nr:hypothetical protein [Candidatus Pacearchaeota archaeon]